ncbi:MAG: tetratricopeptide repeat protein [Planctomycetaceae bacterium]
MKVLSSTRPARCLVGALMLLTGCAHVADRVAAFRRAESGPQAKFNTARQHERDGELDAAREIYEALHQSDPQNAAVCHRLAVVTLRTGDAERAMRSFAEARRLDPHNADLLNDLGYAQYLQSDLAAAEGTLRAALREDPEHRRATTNLALVVGFQGRLEESLSLFRQVVGEAQASANIAYIYAERGKRREAVEHYRRALALDGDLKSAGHALVQLAETDNRLASGGRQPPETQPQPAHAGRSPAGPPDPIQTVAATQPEQTAGVVRIAGFNEERDGGLGPTFADYTAPHDAEPPFVPTAAEEIAGPVDDPQIVPSLDELPAGFEMPVAPPPHPPADAHADANPPSEPPRLWSDEQERFQWQSPVEAR